MNLLENLVNIKTSIEKAQQASPLAAPTVTLLAATKTQSIMVIEAAIKAGMTHFGENRVQEAEDKWPDIKKKHPDIQLHLIGALQTNKIKQALMVFDVIQTLDRFKLADAIASIRDAGQSLLGKQFYIQVNTGKEPQKSGVYPEEVDDFLYYCKSLALPVVGLMCVPPAEQPSAPHFALLHQIAERHQLLYLSMGMSEDYEVAVRMGSTCVRIGRALFGERN